MPLGEVFVIRKEQDLDIEWRIKNFFSLKDLFYNSPEFYFNDESWLLGIYPTGFSRDKSIAYIRLRLATLRESDSPISFQYSLSLKTLNEEKYQETHRAGVFDEWSRLYERSRNYPVYHSYVEISKFISREELRRRRFQLVPSGVLTLVCSLKSPRPCGNETNEKTTSLTETGNKKRFKRNSNKNILKKRRAVHAFSDDSDDKEEDISLSEEVSGIGVIHNAKTSGCVKSEVLDDKNESAASSENQIGAVETKEFDGGSLCQDFKKMWLEGLNHDLFLEVRGKQFRVHQDVLRARSPVFKSTLSRVPVGKQSSLYVHGCDPLAMEQFLCYIYTGKVEILDQSNMLELYYIANKYAVTGLKNDCFNFIKTSMSHTNNCSVITFSLKHKNSSLYQIATEYFIKNAANVMRTAEWRSFMKDNFTVANELIIKSLENKK